MVKSNVIPQFAPVVPVSVAYQMYLQNTLGKYHLLLAHDVEKHAGTYRTVYTANQFQTIIMDNSVIELGHPIGLDSMKKALAAIYDPTHRLVVVLPDELLKKDKTLQAIHSGLREWFYPLRDAFPTVEFMAVPQGSNIGEWVSCIEHIDKMFGDQISWIGIPRNFREKLGGTRAQAVQMAQMLRADWNLHLLGFSDDLHDDLITCHFSARLGYNLHGIDSAVPIRVAMREGQELSFSNQVHSPRGDWWDKPGSWERSADLVKLNVDNVRRWIK